MTTGKHAILIFTLILALLLAATVSARQAHTGKRADLVQQLSQIPRMAPVRVTDPTQLDPKQAELNKPRWIPLGAPVSKHVGIGEVVDHTYDDYQWGDEVNKHVAVAQGTGMADIHFVYSDAPSSDSGTVRRGGYNVYDATDGSWPQTQDIGCLLQASAENGGGSPGIDVFPDGLVVMTAFDSEGEPVIGDHTFYYQEFPHDCNWLTNYVPQATYTAVTGWADPDSTGFALPSIATQMNGTDRITHVFGIENGRTGSLDGGPWGAIQLFYFRKIGNLETGSWTNGALIDSCILFGSHKIVANQNTGDVALIYHHLSATGISQQNWLDNDLYLRESSNYGVTWGPKTNITSFVHDGTEIAPDYSCSWGEDIDAVYDSNNDLHVVFTAMPIPIDPYNAATLFEEWGDFNVDLLHWSRTVSGPNAGGTIVKVADGSYDPTEWDAFDWNVYHCGFGPNVTDAQYITNPQIAQCGDHLYTVWGQIHSKLGSFDPEVDTTFADSINGHALDCQGERLNDNRADANWEIFASVSTSLNGLLWDPARNLTNTITDTCWPDSGRECGDEYAVSMSSRPLEQTGGLVFPDNEVVAGGGTYSGDHWLNLTYVDDEYPSAWWIGDDGGLEYPASFNAVRWIRMACSGHIVTNRLEVDVENLDWPDAYVLNGSSLVIPMTLTTVGNEDIHVSDIQLDEQGGATGWLNVAQTSLTIPAGPDNVRTVDLTIDATALTGENWLEGTVNIVSDANSCWGCSFNFRLLAADAVEEMAFDTVATSTAWDSKGALALGDNVALGVSNYGELGMNGEGGVNLDFTVDGNDCDAEADVYLFSGSPFLLENDGTDIAITTSVYRDNQADVCSWDPYPEVSMSGGMIGSAYSYVSTGTMVNRDTTIGLSRRVIAPLNNLGNPSFVVVESKLYARDGMAHDGVTFGDVMDWDVPSDDGSDNISGGTTPSGVGGMFLYLQGSDTTGHDGCQSNTNRFAAQAMLGWYTNAEYNNDPCANNLNFHGAQGVNVRDYFDDPEGEYEPDADLWWTTVGTSGITGQGTPGDQGTFFTYIHDQLLGATDTLTFYVLYTTLRNGDLDDLKANVKNAQDWYIDNVRGTYCGGCCVCPTVGNVDGSADCLVTMGDLTVLIDHLFISLTPLACEEDGDVDWFWTDPPDGLVTMGDLTVLIDALFISLQDLPPCP